MLSMTERGRASLSRDADHTGTWRIAAVEVKALRERVRIRPECACHGLVDDRGAIRIIATVKCSGPTGVEMEALTAASVAALTIYDMTKALDKGAVIESVKLLAKSGGKSGDYAAPAQKVFKAPSPPARAMSS